MYICKKNMNKKGEKMKYICCLLMFVQVVGIAFSQTSGSDVVKLDLRLGADCRFLPSDKLQYLSYQATYGNHANNKDYSDFSTAVSAGLSYGRCRLEAGAAVSFANMDYYGSDVSDFFIGHCVRA